MKELAFVILFSIVAIIVVTVPLVLVSNWQDRKRCEALGVSTGHQTRWSFYTDCQVKLKDGWTPAANWRAVE